MNLTTLKNKLHKQERDTKFVADLFSSIFKKLQKISAFVDELKAQFFFDTLTFSASAYEKLMNLIVLVDSDIEDRRSAIHARWRANGKNTVKLIQDLCNAWKNGEIEAHFIDGKIALKFVGSVGIPNKNALQSLMLQIEEVIPAHIGFFWIYKFLLKRDIHNVMTKSEMEKLTKNKYCEVKTNG